jgi:hypothetical protein
MNPSDFPLLGTLCGCPDQPRKARPSPPLTRKTAFILLAVTG